MNSKDIEESRNNNNSEDDEYRRNTFLTNIQNNVVNDIIPLVKKGDNTNCDEKIKIVIGVSGGCDSTSLLHALHQLALPQLELHAVHFDHNLRGLESDGDRKFVEKLCHELSIPLQIYYWEEDKLSDTGGFTQDIARDWRRRKMYELLMSLLGESGYQQGFLATAHHKKDSIESMIMKLLRGVHISNLSGMEIVSTPKDQPNAIWIRPLLKVTKDDIIHFLTSQSLKWREDSSNDSSKYKRNRVRNELIPLMADIVGSEELLEKRLKNLSNQSKEVSHTTKLWAQRYLDESGSNHDLFILPIEEKEMTFIHREAFHLWCRRGGKGPSLSYDQLQRIFTQLENYPWNDEWTLQINGTWDVIRKGSALQLINKDKDSKNIDMKLVTWSTIEKEQMEDKRIDDGNIVILRVTKLPSRHYYKGLSGDGAGRLPFTPPWRANRTPIKLKDFFRGQKIPLHLRDHIKIIFSSKTINDSDDRIPVAVYINEKWIIDAKFCPKTNEEGFLIKLSDP